MRLKKFFTYSLKQDYTANMSYLTVSIQGAAHLGSANLGIPMRVQAGHEEHLMLSSHTLLLTEVYSLPTLVFSQSCSQSGSQLPPEKLIQRNGPQAEGTVLYSLISELPVLLVPHERGLYSVCTGPLETILETGYDAGCANAVDNLLWYWALANRKAFQAVLL